VGERLSVLEKWRIAELAAQGLPSRVIGREVGRSHRAVWGYIRVLRRLTAFWQYDDAVPEDRGPGTVFVAGGGVRAVG
jgi:hypothetical protein